VYRWDDGSVLFSTPTSDAPKVSREHLELNAKTTSKSGLKEPQDCAYNLPHRMRVLVGQGHVIAGLDAVLPTLSQGQIAELTIPPLFAYGGATSSPATGSNESLPSRESLDIAGLSNTGSDWFPPPNTTLLVQIELIQARCS
jgi:FKBP-type peptidyl-prolyl cis-trans isomerase